MNTADKFKEKALKGVDKNELNKFSVSAAWFFIDEIDLLYEKIADLEKRISKVQYTGDE